MKITLPLLILASVGAITAWWLQSAQPPGEISGVMLPQPRPLQPFTLTNHVGAPFTEESLKGQWNLLFFGYTRCPDICPTTLTVLKGVAQQLEKRPELASSTRFVFVSVDPQRDSPAHLKEYLAFFNPTFTAATGSREQLDNLTGQVGAIYMFEGDTSRDDYIVNHSAAILIIDPQGRLYGHFTPPHSASGIAESYQRLRAFHDR